jgi:hypothetical protein
LLVTHGYEKDAEKVVSGIEEVVRKETHQHALAEAGKVLTIRPRKTFGFRLIGEAMISKYRGRSALALSLMVAQAFLYNAVFFTYGLVLTRFYGVSAERIGLYLLPLAVDNFLGPLFARSFLRHHRPKADDQYNFRLCRVAVDRYRRAVRNRPGFRCESNDSLDSHLLLRVGCIDFSGYFGRSFRPAPSG